VAITSVTNDKLLKPPFLAERGRCWLIELPDMPAGEAIGNPFPSPLQLFEDAKPLGPAHSCHDDIRNQGRGRYSHWRQTLYFAPSDESDPNTNGRVYSIRFDATSPDFLQHSESGARGVSDVEVWLYHLGVDYDLRGKRVCEIGPGSYLAASLVLFGLGADCITIDRAPSVWNPELHPALIQAICQLAPQLGRPFFPSRLQCVIEEQGFGPLQTYANGLEAAGSDFREAADLTLSASTLEHVADVGQSIGSLYKITRPGGFGVHCIDMRDHDDFARPLDFLLYSQEEYDVRSDQAYRYQRGNRVRPPALMDVVDRSEFFASKFVGFLESDLAYREDIRERLKRSDSPFAGDARDDLRLLNGVLRLSKCH
jgi:hypothetical protein